MSEGSLAFNPDFDPDGNEGGVDTNLLPWLTLSGVTAFSIKPLRASMESGMFSIIIRLEQGASLTATALPVGYGSVGAVRCADLF